MNGYLIHRALRALLIVVGVSVCSFVLTEFSRGDFYAEARLDPNISKDTIAALRAEHGLDRPIRLKYESWLWSVVRGEWGFSLSYNTPVGPLLRTRAQNTLLLTCIGTLLAWLVAIPSAFWSVMTSNPVRRLISGGGISLLLATPELLVVLALLYIAARSGILPAGGMTSLDYTRLDAWGRLQDLIRHLALPVTALVLAAFPALFVHSASALTQALEWTFIKAARASGIGRLRILYRHALPVAAHPLISLFGLSIGALLSSSLLVEAATGWPGLGKLLLDAILQRDQDVVVGVVVLSSCLLVAGNLLADVLLYVTDLRIRHE
jgi:peptide/nickel transport system permease protein